MAAAGGSAQGRTLGEGANGVVYEAHDSLVGGRRVAVKKVRMGRLKEGVNMTALREIRFLKELRHPHVVELLDVFPHKRNLMLVYEYLDCDLEHVINDSSLRLRQSDVKAFFRMALEGLAACHKAWVLHRDFKPNNLLIGRDGSLKLADFGASRCYGDVSDFPGNFTTQVFARWYRAPELLFGAKQYGPGVDLWAAGCVFAELMLRKPFLPADSDLKQLSLIFDALGTPTEDEWPRMATLPGYLRFETRPKPARATMRALFRNCSDDALDLLLRLLAFDPGRRISAADALRHPYFSSDPPPTPAAKLPLPRRVTEAATDGGEARAAGEGAQNLGRNGLSAAGGAGEAPGTVGLGNDVAATQPSEEILRRGSYPMARGRAANVTITDPRPGEARRLLDDPRSGQSPPGTFQLLSAGVEAERRPTVEAGDLAYLRKRKAEMEAMFEDAQED